MGEMFLSGGKVYGLGQLLVTVKRGGGILFFFFQYGLLRESLFRTLLLGVFISLLNATEMEK